MALLQSRVLAGNAPAAAQMKGPQLRAWAAAGVLSNIDDVARNWDAMLSKVVADNVKYQGHYVAVPLNVHRVNWLWINAELLAKTGLPPPTTWDEFFVVADALKRIGVTPLSHGGQSWQDLTLFESVVLGVGGPDFYRSVFVTPDSASYTGKTMTDALEIFRRLRSYVDPHAGGKDWNLATNQVIAGNAAMQIMGDWAKGEFLAANRDGLQRFICIPSPGTAGAFDYSIDSLAMFNLRDKEKVVAQKALATSVFSPEFQEVFSQQKGSIPARTDLKLSQADHCAKRSSLDFVAASKAGTLVPSAAHGMTLNTVTQSALREVISQFWNDARISVDGAQQRLLVASKFR